MVPIEAHASFWDEWARFPPEIQEELGAFLEWLTSNPYDPSLQAKCELDGDERFSYRVGSGYIVYWRVEVDRVNITGSSLDGMTVKLLQIQPPKNVAQKLLLLRER